MLPPTSFLIPKDKEFTLIFHQSRIESVSLETLSDWQDEIELHKLSACVSIDNSCPILLESLLLKVIDTKETLEKVSKITCKPIILLHLKLFDIFKDHANMRMGISFRDRNKRPITLWIDDIRMKILNIDSAMLANLKNNCIVVEYDTKSESIVKLIANTTTNDKWAHPTWL